MSIPAARMHVYFFQLLLPPASPSRTHAAKHALAEITQQAVMDLPAACMVDELVAAYPDAKFILTHRPVHKWLASMNATIFPVMNWRSWQLLRHFDQGFVEPWCAYKQVMLRGWGGDDFGDANMRETFLRHGELVRRVVPGERLLVFEVAEGWGPLCGFLGVERPVGGFPHVNDSEAYVRGFRRARDWVICRVVGKGLVVLVPLMAVVWALYAMF